MYKVLDSYRRFNQKNNLDSRPKWDRSLGGIASQLRETQLQLMNKESAGFQVRDFALAAGAEAVAEYSGGMNRPNAGIRSWDTLPLSSFFNFPDEMPAVQDRDYLTDNIKRAAEFFGADLVGIAELDTRWLYSHHYKPETRESIPVELGEQYRSVIVMAVAMDYEMVKTAPSALYVAETFLLYSKMTFLVSALAQFIRQIGYQAIPSLNDTGLNIPFAIDAGLGQLGRNGLLISPQFGPRQRLCKVITDLPLRPDSPVNFGVTEFCEVCLKCAERCPAQAISYGELTAEATSISTNPGVMKWPISGEKCVEYRTKIVGTKCGICMRVCPFNKSKALFHRLPKRIVSYAPFMDRILVWLDNLLGYGKHTHSKGFWRV
jgi:epoxyqueuosine reductase